ncbi:hypothetical protein T8T21_03880 [Limimaricola variabilis]|uniref:hypothetical protein n=1 Tax=Limimaricola variabilis TaxID=1492771 RepID=UPI002AC938E8|nr:hypothetical protein [Limimaricola variabilis]WPY95275.1 hypothetical protein T8T21_03880 [Limimaricola variabilis]
MAVHPEYGASSFDCLLHSLMHRKRQLASQALWPMGDTKGDLSTLQAGLGQEKDPARPMSIAECMAELFQRDQLPPPTPDLRGAYRMP